MNKAIRVCFIVFTIVYFVLFILMTALGIVQLALSSEIIKGMIEADPSLTAEVCQAMIVSTAVSYFLTASVFLFAACTCVVSKGKVDKGNLTFRSKLTIGIFNVVIGSMPSGVLLIVQAATQRHRKEI